ncbi:MAG: nucleoside monophosphate kinase [Alphaproteobacteria bacterium]
MKNISILLVGPPCSGKSYVSQFILKKFPEINYFSISSILKELSQNNNPKGKEIAQCLKNGNIVPINIIQKVIDTIQSKQGINLIDGFPRDLEQLKCFNNIKNIHILYINVEETEILRRANLRRICTKCNFIHLEDPSKKCPICGNAIKTRDDDQKILYRLNIYKKHTLPVIIKLKELYPENFYNFNGDLKKTQQNIETTIEKIIKGAF